MRHFGLDGARLARDCQSMLDRLPRGSSAIEDFSELIPYAIKEGWMYASLLFGDLQVRTGHLLVAQLKSERLRMALYQISREFEKVRVETLTDEFRRIVAGSPEQAAGAETPGAEPGEASGAIAPAQMGKQEALKRFAVDLTARARAGQLDPVTGRDE